MLYGLYSAPGSPTGLRALGLARCDVACELTQLGGVTIRPAVGNGPHLDLVTVDGVTTLSQGAKHVNGMVPVTRGESPVDRLTEFVSDRRAPSTTGS